MSTILNHFQHFFSCHFHKTQKTKGLKRILLFCPFAVLLIIAIIVVSYLGHNVSWEKQTALGHLTNVNTAYAISDTLVSTQTSEVSNEASTEIESESVADNKEFIKDQNQEKESSQNGPETDVMYGTVQVHDFVNIRLAPNTDAEILGKLYNGDEVIVIGTSFADHEWYQIRYGSLEGFAKAEYFTVEHDVN